MKFVFFGNVTTSYTHSVWYSEYRKYKCVFKCVVAKYRSAENFFSLAHNTAFYCNYYLMEPWNSRESLTVHLEYLLVNQKHLRDSTNKCLLFFFVWLFWSLHQQWYSHIKDDLFGSVIVSVIHCVWPRGSPLFMCLWFFAFITVRWFDWLSSVARASLFQSTSVPSLIVSGHSKQQHQWCRTMLFVVSMVSAEDDVEEGMPVSESVANHTFSLTTWVRVQCCFNS